MAISTIGELVAYLRDKKTFLHERFGVTRMGVFGSFEQGGQTVRSDIDLVVEFEKARKNIHNDFSAFSASPWPAVACQRPAG